MNIELDREKFENTGIYIEPSDCLTFIFTRVECVKCGYSWRVRSMSSSCPKCHSKHLNLLGYEVIEVS
jgi:Zn finger protein HypA/HybF involved in hydrogenase expression